MTDPLDYLTETPVSDDPVAAALLFTGAAVAGVCAGEGALHLLRLRERRKDKDAGFER